ncbi:MAG: hypothetical protein WBA51_04070 [Erythrobacter sp.]
MALIASAFWAERRFAAFARLPAQFGITGKPSWFAPRSFVLWITPVIFACVIAMLIFSVSGAADVEVKGSPSAAMIWTSAITVAVQGLILWLISSWADGRRRGQGSP